MSADGDAMDSSDSVAESSGAALADDSGHYSCASDEPRISPLPRSQEQSLYLVMQELRKSRSDVERLSKSEKWYKQELKSQKHNRLEALERLYAQERKYMQENQRLQKDCMRLYTKCATLEREMQTPTPMPLPTLAKLSETAAGALDFSAQQQRMLLADQHQLVELLRKQKKLLLADIQRLSLEHDDKMLQLQRTLAGLELENKHVTSKCKQLLDEKSALEQSLETRSETLRGVTAERETLCQVIGDLNETLQTQEQLLALKEQEFLDLKQHYSDKLRRECSMDAVHSYSLAFHAEINAKTSEIAALKNSLHELQNELSVMSELEAQNAAQQRQLEHLNFALEAQQCEHENLKISNALSGQQVEDLTDSIASLQQEKEELAAKLRETQTNLRSLEQQLIELHRKYAEMCAMCESAKFRLAEQQSEHEEELRNKLEKYVNRCAQLSDAMATAEAKLDRQTEEAAAWQQQLAKKTRQLETLRQTQLEAEQRTAKESIGTQTEADDAADMLELKQRVEQLEQQLLAMEAQKQQTVMLLQRLLREQDDKIRNTAKTEADWRQLLEALQATQDLEEQRREQLQLKTEELEQLNELFADQNEELQQLQESRIDRERQRRAQREIEMDKMKQLQLEREQSARQAEQLRCELATEQKAEKYLRGLIHVLETETGRKLQDVKSWPLLAKLLRKELRSGKSQSKKSPELWALRREFAEVNGKYKQAQAKIGLLEQNLDAERAHFAASDLGKSTANIPQVEPAHEVANLIDDYKKLIEQTANETGRPRTSYILKLIERSQRSKPNLCQLEENLVACRKDVLHLNEMLSSLPRRDQKIMPSLMDELRAVAEIT